MPLGSLLSFFDLNIKQKKEEFPSTVLLNFSYQEDWNKLCVGVKTNYKFLSEQMYRAEQKFWKCLKLVTYPM